MSSSYLYKSICLGNPSVNKSEVIRDLSIIDMPPNNHYSIGVNFGVVEQEITHNITCKLQIWDFVPMNRYFHILPLYCRGASISLIFFDFLILESWETVYLWIDLVRNNTSSCLIYLIGINYTEDSLVSEGDISEFVDLNYLQGYYILSPESRLDHNIIKQMCQNLVFDRAIGEIQTPAEELRERLEFCTSRLNDENDYNTDESNTDLYDSLYRIRIRDYLPPPPPQITNTRQILQRELRAVVYRPRRIPPPPHSRSPAIPFPSNDNRRFNSDNGSLGSLRDEMLRELDRLRNIMRDGHDSSFDKLENALSEEEHEIFEEFLQFYNTCPVCGSENHRSYLVAFYFNEESSRRALRDRLLEYLDKAKHSNIHNPKAISFGIPCCKCYKKFFNEDIAYRG
ncbi:MAG: hypothetical protein GF364_14595 [Candidatus Lokiarchaeota archaeon]|nr:hypothetical protein [Candidatus Lokiarchaeota archaeon]